ncbi:MAG: pyridoxal phosphate-dependent aminotransferase [Planctomycetota bacterium]|nr:pyridoxal phosphate-dependent aminotransferase [Planctomycetota bacterium]
MQLSERVKAIKPSSTLAVTAKSKAMKAAGIDVIGFGAGEPDYDTPKPIKAAAAKALEEGKTKYEATAGSVEARAAVAKYMNTRHGFNVTGDNVIISVGGKHSLYVAFMSLMNPGDELLLPAPYWVSYPEQAKLAGGTVKEIPGSVDNDFKITPAQLEKAIGPKSRVLVINSPSNPTGTMYSPAELKALAEVVAKHPNLLVFADDIYERLVYGSDKFVSFSTLHPALAERTVTFNCLSKTYAMTGWRVGFTIGPKDLIKAMDALQGQMTSNITSFVLPAVAVALDPAQDAAVETMRVEFDKRGKHIHQRLLAIPGVKCPKPTGAFYVFPDVSKAVFGKTDPAGKRITTAAGFAESLLEHAKVAVVPGEDFGGPNHVRLSFATGMKNIDSGLDRIEAYVKALK